MSEVLKNRINTALCIPVIYGVLLSVLSGCATESGEGADPGIVDQPIAYVKRTIPVDPDNNNAPIQPDARNPLLFSAGGDVFIRDRSSVGANETNITAAVTNGIGDVKDLEVSFDGRTLIFSLRIDDPDITTDDTNKWNIYQYDLDAEQLTPVVNNVAADEGDDIAPHYLPDGRIVFSSNRQARSKAVLTDESGVLEYEGNESIVKRAFESVVEDRGIRVKTFVIHVMNNDGSNIKQISFNQSHDLDPVVLNDGNILFSRWDRSGNNNELNLYTMAPDGSNLQMYYGAHSNSHDIGNNSVQFTQPRVMPDGKIIAIRRPYSGTYNGGDIVIIDADNYIDIDQPTGPNLINLAGTSAQRNATVTNIVIDGSISAFGRYSSAYPLRDGSNRILVSKGACQLTVDDVTDSNIIAVVQPCIEPYLSDPNVMEMPSYYGIWVYDMNNDTELPIVIAEPGKIITDVVAMQPQTPPPIVFDKLVDPANQDVINRLGYLNIRSVYDFGDPNATFDGCFISGCGLNAVTSITDLADPAQTTSDQRQARFLRIIKAVGLPDRNDPDLTAPPAPNLSNNAFGRNINLGMKEIIGYTMIEPDGSVRVKVPADIAFGIEVLDKDGMRIGLRHDNWLQVNPGDELKCNGCHSHPTGVNAPLPLPHGRGNAEAASMNAGALANGVPFPNTQNPLVLGDYLTNFQDTMAEARTAADPNALIPAMDIVFDDRWTDPNDRAVDASFSYTYNNLTTAKPVAPISCLTTWTGLCRIIIHYAKHISPIWSEPRGAGGVDTCTNCHSTVAGMANQVPQGQLNLVSDLDINGVDDHQISYRDLMFNDVPKGIIGANEVPLIIDEPIPDGMGGFVLDVNGNQVTQKAFAAVDDPDTSALLLSDYLDANGNVISVPRSMIAGSARSSYFMEVMMGKELDASRTYVPVAGHSTYLTQDELKLIAEWLDIGAQYYNNPFNPAAP